MLEGPSVGAEEAREGEPVPPAIPTEGGGATTFAPSEAPTPLRFPVGLPFVAVPDAGGGGTTLLASEGAVPLLLALELTVGGGGTTSVAPKIFPIKLPMNDPLAVAAGGGGTTVLEESAILPPAIRRTSGDTSEDGGGATTEGAGKLSLAFREVARSGAETGGGTTAAFIICTEVVETSRLTAPGAGGITFATKAGLERA